MKYFWLWGSKCDIGGFDNMEVVGNKAKGRISKWVFQENKAR